MEEENIMRLWKKGIALLTMTALAVGLVGCGVSKGEDDSQVHIGYFNNVTHAQALYLKANGTLEKSFGDDVAVKWSAFNAGPAEVEALFAGDIDIGYIGPVPAITANAKSKGDVQILSGVTKGGAILITGKDSNITDISQLSGKKVSIPQIGNTQHLCLLQLLQENGLKPTTEGGDVTVSAVENADVSNTIERGDVDAALVPEPWGATLLEQGAKMLLDYDQIYLEGKYDVAVVVVRKEFREAHPDIVEKFLKAHEEATQTINDDRENALQVINTELEDATGKSLSETIIKEAFNRIEVSAEYNKESIDGFAQISKEQKFIDEVPESGLFVNE